MKSVSAHRLYKNTVVGCSWLVALCLPTSGLNEHQNVRSLRVWGFWPCLEYSGRWLPLAEKKKKFAFMGKFLPSTGKCGSEGWMFHWISPCWKCLLFPERIGIFSGKRYLSLSLKGRLSPQPRVLAQTVSPLLSFQVFFHLVSSREQAVYMDSNP